MKKRYYTSLFYLILLTSCGGSNPAFEHITVKSDSEGVLLDTDNPDTLEKIQTIFYKKEKAPDAAPDFMYFIDISRNGESSRWQYSHDGFFREYTETNSMIYKIIEVNSFNKITNIN